MKYHTADPSPFLRVLKLLEGAFVSTNSGVYLVFAHLLDRLVLTAHYMLEPQLIFNHSSRLGGCVFEAWDVFCSSAASVAFPPWLQMSPRRP